MENIKAYLLSALSIIFVSCVNNTTEYDNTRKDIKVTTSINDTKTSIEYEYSDYSHLVWDDGDKVAYITDVYGDVTSSATITDGIFTASVPTETSEDNKLIIVYPSGENVGNDISNIYIDIPSENIQDSVFSSSGINIPMYSVVDLKDIDKNAVSADYVIPVSIVRFSIDTLNHSNESVKSISMTAEQALGGKMTFNGNDFILSDETTTVTTTIGRPTAIKDLGYIYLPVLRGNYENVSVIIETDQNKYLLKGGRFELDKDNTTLYKTTLRLDVTEIIPDIAFFKEISADEVFSPENKYLMAYKESDNSYRIATTYSSYKMNNMLVTASEDGIAESEELMDYIFTITPVGDHYAVFSQGMANTAKNPFVGCGYLGAPGGTTLATGNFFLLKDIPAEDNIQYLWDIEYSDKLTITNAQQTVYDIKFDFMRAQFAPCQASADAGDITLLKLN